MKELVFSDSINFIFPIDGDCINENDGTAIEEGVRIYANVLAPEGHDVMIEGTRAEYNNGIYRAKVDVVGSECQLTAEDMTDGTRTSVKVFRLSNPLGGYRLSSDDNIIFLYDINLHKDEYTSIFDNPYLAIYKKAHELYGAKVHLNLFYEFDSKARECFSDNREYFNLSMMTDKFKDEFERNSDWLKFSFHSKSEMPPSPYKYADGETVRRDAIEVMREIVRFAGSSALSRATTVHFGEITEDGVRALRTLGYEAFMGFFKNPGPSVAYYAAESLTAHIYERDFWRDTELDANFGRIDLVLNTYPNSENLEILKKTMESKTRGGFISVMIHEQYFYKDYCSYIPEFEKRVLDACCLLSKNGYKGRHITEAIGISPAIESGLV